MPPIEPPFRGWLHRFSPRRGAIATDGDSVTPVVLGFSCSEADVRVPIEPALLCQPVEQPREVGALVRRQPLRHLPFVLLGDSDSARWWQESRFPP